MVEFFKYFLSETDGRKRFFYLVVLQRQGPANACKISRYGMV